MKKIHAWAYYALFMAIVCLIGCGKTEITELDSEKTAELSVEFDNIVGNRTLQLETGSYVNAVGESFNISLLQYYVSNFRLQTTVGKNI